MRLMDFGVPEADETARRQVLEQILGRDAAGSVVEVDQHVSAEDDIECAVSAGFRPRSTMLAEVNWTDWRRSATIRQRSFSVRHEVFFDQSSGDSRISARLPYSPARGGRHALGVDVGADDLDVLDVDLGQFSSSQMAIE